MSIAAATKVAFSDSPAADAFQCTAVGCIALTASHYCTAHAVSCTDCSAEHEAGTLVGGKCVDCARLDAGEVL